VWLLSGLLAAGCSGKSANGSSGLDSECAAPTGVVLTKPQVDAAIAGIKRLFSGKLSFEVDPTVVRVLTDSRRADLIVTSLMCTAEKRGDINSNDIARVEYTRKLFLYTWGSSPVPGPEDVQAWTVSHPFSNVTADPAPSGTFIPFDAERFDAVDDADSCTQHTIPAGVPVCVRLPATSTVGLYAAEAHDRGLALTSIHPGQPASWFKQNIDYAVCIRSAPAEVNPDATLNRALSIEIDSRSREQCLGTRGSAAPDSVQR
jgi:hypothetical protein